MRLKNSSVRFVGIKEGILRAFPVVEKVYTKYGKEPVITSLNDSHHMKGSLHYKGEAMDIRTFYFSKQTQILVIKELRNILGEEFDIILEKDHIHIEYDPK